MLQAQEREAVFTRSCSDKSLPASVRIDFIKTTYGVKEDDPVRTTAKKEAVVNAESELKAIEAANRADTTNFEATYQNLGGTSRAESQQLDRSPNKAQQQQDSLDGNRTAVVTQPNPQENADVKEALLKAQELLAKANGGTCSNSCNCAIA